MTSCLTLFVPSWNKIAVILYILFMVMDRCLTVRGPSSNMLAIDIITLVMASCLTLIAPSWDRIAVIIDCVFMVMGNCLAESVNKHMYPSRRDK